MKYCRECGNEVSDNAKHCSNCGKELQIEPEVEVLELFDEPKEMENNNIDLSEPEVLEPIEEEKDVLTEKRQIKYDNGTMLIMVSIIVIIAVITIIVNFIGKRDPFIGTWVVTQEYSNEDTIKISLLINKDNTFEYKKSIADSSSINTTLGTWEKLGDRIVLKYKKNGMNVRRNVYLHDTDTLCFNTLDCKEEYMLIKSTSLKSKSIKLYNDDYDYYDYYYNY